MTPDAASRAQHLGPCGRAAAGVGRGDPVQRADLRRRGGRGIRLGPEDPHAHEPAVGLAVRLHDHLEQLLEGVGIELERDLLARLAGGGLGGGLARVDLAARHVVHVAPACGDHEHPPVAHERDGGDEEVGQLGHPTPP